MSRTFAKLPLNVEGKVWDDKPFTLSQRIASGTYGDDEYEIFQNAVSFELYISWKGQYYEVSMQAVMQALIDATKES
jgi:hypothetical protein